MRTFADAGRVLGEREEQVMDLLWESPPMSVRDVCNALRRKRLAYTTLMTTLDRLYRKGLLARSRDGIAYVYRPAMSREDYHRRVVEGAMSQLVASAAEPVLAAFVDIAADIDEDNLARLERLIAAR